MRGRRLAISAAMLALLNGCTSSADPVGTAVVTSPVTGSVAHALSLWSTFPATSSSRPLVLAGPAVNDPATGFPSTADKIAYNSGHFSVRTSLPGSSAKWERHPLITAAQALTDLRGSSHGASSTGSPLLISGVRLGTAPFSTDRGQRRLPAWLFTFAHVRDPASVLAIAPANRWPASLPADGRSEGLTAEIAPGGRTVTITFVGAAAGTGPCTSRYQARTTQSNSAVLISIHEIRGSQAPGQACDAVGHQRTATVSLTPALAARVLIDANGAPIPTA